MTSLGMAYPELTQPTQSELNRKTQQAELADQLMRECEAMETEIAMLKNKRSPSEVRRPQSFTARRLTDTFALVAPHDRTNQRDPRGTRQ